MTESQAWAQLERLRLYMEGEEATRQKIFGDVKPRTTRAFDVRSLKALRTVLNKRAARQQGEPKP